MTNEITNPQLCVLMRSGIQVWVDADKANELIADLNSGKIKGFIVIGGEMINTVDISGIYTPEKINEYNKSKSGQWKCEHGNWLPRNKRCQCEIRPEYRDY